MKQICYVIMFAAIAANIVFADDVSFTGEWLVEIDDAGDSGIAVVINEPEQVTWAMRGYSEVYTDSGLRMVQVGAGRQPKIVQYNFTIIPAGTFFDFDVNGSELTGSIIRQGTEKPILNGKIKGNTITFTVREILNEKDYSYSYTGELSNDYILFEVKASRDGGKPFKFTAKRVPD